MNLERSNQFRLGNPSCSREVHSKVTKMHLEFSLNKRTKQRHRKNYCILSERLEPVPPPAPRGLEIEPVDHWLRNGSWKNRVILAHGRGVRLFCRVSAPGVSWHQRAPSCKACLFAPSLLQERGEWGKWRVRWTPVCHFGPGLFHCSRMFLHQHTLS